MGDDKTPLDQLLDLLFYAPVGVALTATEELPRMVEKGRSRVGTQVSLARMIGRFALAEGQRQATAHLRQVSQRLAAPTRAQAGAASRPAPSGDAAGTPSPWGNGHVPAPPAARRPDGAGLAIPGYDTLSASQVVQRLAGLAAEELDAVLSYESATRGRRTVLNRIAQLQNDEDS
ncbi:MAG TPA: hypothetical protein VF954_02685 [Acidimicrobiales bacterium]